MADISVIIPCCNAAPYIDRCMTTITSQTIGIDALEIICIDDTSTDYAWEHLQMWESNLQGKCNVVSCQNERDFSTSMTFFENRGTGKENRLMRTVIGDLCFIFITRFYFVEERLYHYFVNTASSKNADYHTDWLTVQSMKLEEWEKRGFH